MITRRFTRRSMLTGGLAAGAALASNASLAQTVLGDDGLHKQPWMLDSFLEVGSDLADAREAGKGLIVLFEQRGCPYCKELHEVNFADARITEYLEANFDALQLDIWGSREAANLDGETMEEKQLAREWQVNFTPTTLFFAKDGPEKEVFRLPGYFKPFHYMSGLEYVAEGHYQDQNFQRYLQEKFAALEAEGKTPEVW